MGGLTQGSDNVKGRVSLISWLILLSSELGLLSGSEKLVEEQL